MAAATYASELATRAVVILSEAKDLHHPGRAHFRDDEDPSLRSG